MRKLIIAGLAAAALPGIAQAAAFTNGSFEQGTDPGNFTNADTTSTAITGWTVTSGNVDYIGTYWTAGDGSRSVDLTGGAPGTLSQTFDTAAGTSYLVRFLLAGNPAGDPSVKTLNVSATGGSTASYTFDDTGKTLSNMGWTAFTYGFTATGGSTTLSFASTTAGSYGPALDGVSVSAVPEPATWAMMIGGFGLVGGTLRRRRAVATLASA